ncbi:MAG: hypothetical protein F2839_06440 [Actinobacteria bacterium]|uniref:Unannotated protein n=1 Tax=freshwater metagenome TaxID=449393 RepID=A0A6J5ZMS4_9ZZZZ|nr:hypothetical protein [Actinomycetota bacterium]
MCLSPEADIVAALAIGIVAVDTLRRNANPDARALAAIPAIFAGHSLLSALMWWNLRGHIPAEFGSIATNLYILVAFVLWPIYIPLALRQMETRTIRRNVLLASCCLGAIIGGLNLWFLATGRIVATEHPWYVGFVTPALPMYLGGLYGVATCLSMFVSSHNELKWWGLVNLVGISAIVVWARHGLPSVWCFWAAITSVFINWFIRHHSRQHRENV